MTNNSYSSTVDNSVRLISSLNKLDLLCKEVTKSKCDSLTKEINVSKKIPMTSRVHKDSQLSDQQKTHMKICPKLTQ